MPYLLAHLLVAWMCFFANSAWAIGPASIDAIVLSDATPSFEISSDIQTWLDVGSRADITSVADATKRFDTVPALQRHALKESDTLWVRLRLQRAAGSSERWTLNIPLPSLDAVSLFQRNNSGGWTEQMAGDTLAQVNWGKRGLYPEFDLQLPSGSPLYVYLRIRNFKHIGLPLRIATVPTREPQRLLEMTGWGALLGTLLTLSMLSLVRYTEHRSKPDLLASIYSLLVLATIAQSNGVFNVFLWANQPGWGDYASSMFPIISTGVGLLFVRNLYALSTHYHRYDIFLERTAWFTSASALGYLLLERPDAAWLGSVSMAFGLTVGLTATLLSWRGSSSVWRWLMLAYVPQYAGLMRLVAESVGLVPVLWEIRYVTSISVALSVPILLYALDRVTHDRKELKMRANHLPTQDALTGLLTPQAFQVQLDAAYERAVSNREPIALVLIRVANHEAIRQSLGDAVAEQCLLRAVVKLHRILRDVDPAGRVDSAQFGLLLEGISTREALTERMVQLIASGLIPLPGLDPPVTLHFQAACVLLHENPVASHEALGHLDDLLATMSQNTRRPIRFLEAIPTQAGTVRSDIAPT